MSKGLLVTPLLALVACCVCIVIVHGPAHSRTELDESAALRLAEGKVRGDIGGHWVVHKSPHSVAGNDEHEKRAIALAEGKGWVEHESPHSVASNDEHEKRALALAEGKVRGDIGGNWHVHHQPHATAGHDAAEERALALAEGKVRGDIGGHWVVHKSPHSVAGNDEHEKRAIAIAEGKLEDRALRLAEGMEGEKARKSIAAGHATAIAKSDEQHVTVQTKWGPLSAAHGARKQLLRSIEARRPNMHFDKGVSAREVKTLLSRAERMTSGMHEKKESPLVQLNQIQELNAIEKKEAHLQHAMESGAEPARPLGPAGSAHPGDWRRAARGRRQQSSKALKREAMALKLAEEPSRPLGLEVLGAGKRQAVRHEHPQAGKRAKSRDLYHEAAFEEEAIAEKKATLAKKQERLKRLLARQHEAAKVHQALRGVDVLAHGAQRALGDDMVSATAIRRGWLGL